MKRVEKTLENQIIERLFPTDDAPQHLCLDKGYDYLEVRQLIQTWGYTAHIRSRGEERQMKQQLPGYRCRRWVVERTHSRLSRFRRLLIRFKKKVSNYLAILHLGCAWITFRAAGLFG